VGFLLSLGSIANNFDVLNDNGEMTMAKSRICKVPYSERKWSDVIDTNPNASVQDHRTVRDVMAICVDKASVRSATVSGWFEVADVENPFTYEDGSLTVQVKCHWYGLRPKAERDWMHLRIANKYQLVRRFSGDVVDNIEELGSK
jgi:hypothetical protein